MKTKIRYVSSKDIEKIIEYINSLPYMVEKVNMYSEKGIHYFIFILPNDLEKKHEIISGKLD